MIRIPQFLIECCILKKFIFFFVRTKFWSLNDLYENKNICKINCIYPTPPQQGQFLSCLTNLNSEFSFSLTGCRTKVKEPRLPNNLPIADRRIVEYILFLGVFSPNSLYQGFELWPLCLFPLTITVTTQASSQKLYLHIHYPKIVITCFLMLCRILIHTRTRTHTHTYIYIYIYIYFCLTFFKSWILLGSCRSTFSYYVPDKRLWNLEWKKESKGDNSCIFFSFRASRLYWFEA